MSKFSELDNIVGVLLTKELKKLAVDYEDYGTEDIYQQLLDVADLITDNPLMKYELLKVATVYKKAEELNKGYDTVYDTQREFGQEYLTNLGKPVQQQISEVLGYLVEELIEKSGSFEKLSTPLERRDQKVFGQLHEAVEQFKNSDVAKELQSQAFRKVEDNIQGIEQPETEEDFKGEEISKEEPKKGKKIEDFTTTVKPTSEVERLRQQKNKESLEDLEEEPSESIFEMALPGQGDDSGTEGKRQLSKFIGESGRGEEDKTKHRPMTMSRLGDRNYVLYYRNEANQYIIDYKKEEAAQATMTNPKKIADSKKFMDRCVELKNICEELAPLYADLKAVRDQIENVKDKGALEILQKERDDIKDNISELQKRKEVVRWSMRQQYFTEKKDKSDEQVTDIRNRIEKLRKSIDTAKDPQEKMWRQSDLKNLLNLEFYRKAQSEYYESLSRLRDRNKVPESTARKLLLNSFTLDIHGNIQNAPLEETKEKLTQAVHEASKLTISIEEIMQADKLKIYKEMGDVTDPIEAEKAKAKIRENWGRAKKSWDLTKASLDGIVEHINNAISGKRRTVKDSLVRRLSKDEKTIFAPIMQEILKATDPRGKMDKTKLLSAVHALRLKRDELAKKSPEFVAYVAFMRTSKRLYKLKDAIKSLDPLEQYEWECLDESEKQQIQNVIDLCNQILDNMKIQGDPKRRFIMPSKDDPTKMTWHLENISTYEAGGIPGLLREIIQVLEFRRDADEGVCK